MKPSISPETLKAIEALDTCTVANAIETFNVRLRNEGYADASIRCTCGTWPSWRTTAS